MDLLLDVNIVLDICASREPFGVEGLAAIQKCKENGGKAWVYTGSVQTIQYNLAQEIKRVKQLQNIHASFKECLKEAQKILKIFCQNKLWLSALSEEGDVFEAEDPEDAQLVRALQRFPEKSIKLLTRDKQLLEKEPELAISPKEYLKIKESVPATPFIDLQTQQDIIRPVLEKKIHTILHHGQYILGPEVRELEEKLAEYTGAKHCVSVASGTEALLIALIALGIGSGDEVITSPFTFIATAEVIALVGATPVFIDIEPETCNFDANLLKSAITDKTKAIIPVSLYGQMCDMNEINAIAKEAGGIPVIEDAAQSFGAEYKGIKSCNASIIGCTSFFPSKPLGCYGDGGAIFTNDDSLAQAFREIRVHGQSKRYYHTRIGVGGRMDTLQAAVVLAKLPEFESEVKARIEVGARYNKMFDEAVIKRVHQKADRTSVYAQYTVIINDREKVIAKMQAEGLPTSVHYPTVLFEQPAYAQLGRVIGQCANSIHATKSVMSLPMHPYLSAVEQSEIVEKVKKVIETEKI